MTTQPPNQNDPDHNPFLDDENHPEDQEETQPPHRDDVK